MKRTGIAICLSVVILSATAFSRGSHTPAAVLPNPVLVFMGAEEIESGGKWTRYSFSVYNREVYPNELFGASPELPACGLNTNASRTWVDLYDESGHRLNGFCALGSPSGLARIWFVIARDAIPPSWIYILMKDRKTNTTYKSNLAETTL